MSISELSLDLLSVVVGGADAADASKCFYQPQNQADYDLMAAMVKGARKEGGKALLQGKGTLPTYKALLKDNLCVAPLPNSK